MSNLIWKIKQTIRQYMPMIIAAAIAYGGYAMIQTGTFGRSLRGQVNGVLYKLPVFGSYIRRHNAKQFGVATRESHKGRKYRRHGRRRRR